MASIVEEIEKKFVETVALLVKEGQMSGRRTDFPEYRKGWVEGYGRAWTQVTGHSIYDLQDRVNACIKGCGRTLEI